jgi:hypothetical protein
MKLKREIGRNAGRAARRRRAALGALMLAALASTAGGVARGDLILTPSPEFADQGTLSVTSGGTFATGSGTTAPTLTVGSTVYDGTIYTYSGGQQVAVFQFDSIAVSGGTLTGTGALPVVLLSYGNVSVTGSGSIDFSGSGGGFDGGGGPGGGGGNSGSGTGVGGGTGGGGFGVPGGGGGFGGPAYGDLTQALQGGSGGGFGSLFGGGGGGGGGGVEIASNTRISIGGAGILSDGGGGSLWSGGGSGGGILLYAPAVNLNAPLAVTGGGGFYGGGGGGGRILLDTAPGGLTEDSSITVAGGAGGISSFGSRYNGAPGSSGSLLTLDDVPPPVAVPEPSTAIVAVFGAVAFIA